MPLSTFRRSADVARSEDVRVRERILEASTRLFYADGIVPVGVDRIVAEAGVAKMSLYHHFGSKDGLIQAVLEHRDAVWRAWFDDQVRKRGHSPRERLEAVFAILDEWFREPGFRGCPFINAAAELGSAHPARATVAANKAWVRAYLVTLARELRRPRPDEVGGAWFLLFEGAITTALIEGRPEAAGEASQAALAMLKPASPLRSRRGQK